MGAGASAELPSEMHAECFEHNKGLQAVNEALGLPDPHHPEDALVVFQCFAALDQDHSGKVGVEERGAARTFCRRFHEEEYAKHPHAPFLFRFFGVMGKEQQLDPIAFFVSLHGFLVNDEDELLAFCFHMFDKNHDDHLDLLEFQCKLAHPKMTNEEIDDKMVAFDFKHGHDDHDRRGFEGELGGENDDLDLEEVMYKKHRRVFMDLLWPVYRTAEKLRQEVGSEAYWQRRRHAVKKHKALVKGFETGDLVGLFHDTMEGPCKERLLKKKQERINLLLVEQDEKRLADQELSDHAYAERQKFELHNAADEWTKYDDEATGYPYWYNNVTGLSSWEEPATLKAARENAEADLRDYEAMQNRKALAESGIYMDKGTDLA